MERYGQDRKKVTGTTIFGRYLSKMKLKQYNQFRWKDTENLQAVEEKRLREAMEAQGKSSGEIELVIQENREVIPELPTFEESLAEPVGLEDGPTPASAPIVPEPTESAADLGLTDEDVRYLKLRWGATYKPTE